MGSRLEANSSAVRKRIASHTFDSEEGEEYESSKFGGFNDYFRRKKIKLQNLDAELRGQSANNPPIFRGVVAHVNGYTQPSLNDLHQLIVSHGGGFMQYLDGKTTVTHIIASNLTPKKAVEFKQYRIVKPAWVVDSIKAGKLLPWDGYRVVDAGAAQKVLGFDGGKVVSQANVQQRGYRDQTDRSWYTSQLRAEGTAPSSSHRSPFLSQPQRPPTPVEEGIDDFPLDELDDFPTSHQPKPPARVQDDVLEEVDLVKNTNEVLPEQTATPPESGSAEPPSSGPRGIKRTSDDQAGSPSKRARMTAEEHNAILLADPKTWKSTVVNPDFLEQYYRESRLHHLSTWKADLKSQLQALAAEKSSSQKAKQKRVPGTRRYILHVDFDSFFAAVSLKKNPQYVDKPAVVAHGGGTGSEIASCNYPARKFGIKNGMWMKRAQELCSELKVLPYDFPAYEEASRSFYDAIMTTGGIVQSVSIDEALIDVSTICIEAGGSDGKRMSEGSIYREQSEADNIAQGLRDEVKEKTGCAVSVGIGPNILCAKVALRKAKPAGQYQLKPETVLEFIGALEVQDLPGVAYSIGGKLEEIGIKYVRDIREFSRERLINTLGPKTGEKIWEYSRGIDKSEVGDQVIRKSVSAEVNWGVRFVNQEQVDEFIENLCGELQKRLLKERVKGRQLTMKIMRRAADAPLDPPKHLGHGKCDTYNKSLVLGVATNDKVILTKETLSILKGFGFSPGELRGIGVQMTKLEPLKAGGDGQIESSQRRLQFKVGEPSNAPVKETEDPIQDDIVTPKKQKADPDHFKFGPAQLNSDSPSRRPLNTLGTQFILPSQVDPQVLAELPADIRAKLSEHVKLTPTSAKDDRPGDIAPASPRIGQNAIPGTILPAESQLDPETLAALPDDVRAEVLAFYQQAPGPQARPHSQTVLPQSPRKTRTLPPPKRPAPTFPRKRGRPPKSSYLTAASGSSHPTLTQANFIKTRIGRASNSPATTDTEADGEAGEVSADFLAALPEDIRREVMDEQRRARLKKRGGLDFVRKTGARAKPADASTDADSAPEVVPGQQRTLQLPPRPHRPTFTTMKLWQPDELRSALRDWFSEFRDEGPYREDVEALEKYLERVAQEERDMDKAVGTAKWLAWLVEEGYDGGGGGAGTRTLERAKEKWEKAVQNVKDAVQCSVKARGLGRCCELHMSEILIHAAGGGVVLVVAYADSTHKDSRGQTLIELRPTNTTLTAYFNMNRSLSIRSKKDGDSSASKTAPKHRFTMASLRGMQQPELSKKLFKLIKAENHAIGAYESAGRERAAIATQLSEWGEATGDDGISDVSDKLGVLMSEIAEQEDAFAQNLEDYRGVLKQIRNTESSVQPSRDHKAKVSDEIAKLKYKEPQSTKIVQLEQELVRAEAQSLVAEAQLTNITRQKFKEAYDLHFAAVIERAEKQALLAKHARAVLNLLDDAPIVPGESHPEFANVEAGREILNEAEDELRAWQPTHEPITSNAGHLSAGAMPGAPASTIGGTEYGGEVQSPVAGTTASGDVHPAYREKGGETASSNSVEERERMQAEQMAAEQHQHQHYEPSEAETTGATLSTA